jgi:addiction module HigA family antidote
MTTKKIAPVHPGEILWHDFMEPLGISQSFLAKSIGVPPMRISQIVRGQRAITADTALRLSLYFGTRPRWWMDLQSYYDLETLSDQIQGKITRTIKPCSMRISTEIAA